MSAKVLSFLALSLVATACTTMQVDSTAQSSSNLDDGEARCTITSAGDAGKVITATLLLPDAPAAGELFISSTGVIACAAASCASTAGYDSATKISCPDAVVSPGLINPHDHISFANNPPHPPTDERFEQRHDWRKGRRGHTKIPVSAPAVTNAIEAAELRFAMSGVTAIAGAGGAKGLVRNVDGSQDQLESGLQMQSADSDTFPLGDSAGSVFPTTCDGFTGSRRTTSDIANKDAYLPHIAEGIDATAHAELVCQSGDQPTYDLFGVHTAVVHGVAVSASDVQRYKDQGAILVWSPRSNVDLYGNTAPIGMYARMGVPIALGTDWLPSGSMNMSRELHCADDLNTRYFDKALTDKQLWEAVTVNAANAVGGDSTIGQLKAGLLGDVAIFDGKGKANPYRAVIEAGVEDTVLVLRGGKALYGDRALVADPASGGGADCEDLDVCGVAKKACVKRDLGAKTLANLQTAASKVYPLFFCKTATPTNEPSCSPRRGATASAPAASAYDGIAKGDQDGDGVADADDDCPSVFNPIRPMDDGKQADQDNDGTGDACDDTPL